MYNASTIAELEKLKQTLLDQIEHINQTIIICKSMSQIGVGGSIEDHIRPLPTSKYNSYKSRYTYKQKIATILTAENRFLTVKEIADIILSLEPQLKLEEVKKAVGSAKSYMLKDKTIVKYVVGASNNNSFYGSKNWLDTEGNPKPEHMYSEEALVSIKEDIEI